MNQETYTLRHATVGVTPTQLRLAGISSPSKVVSRLRRKGNCIYTNKTASGTVYKIGPPTKRMIAMAFGVAGPNSYM